MYLLPPKKTIPLSLWESWQSHTPGLGVRAKYNTPLKPSGAIYVP